MVELYDTDFVLFKNGEPVEPLDVVYAIESVQELLDDGFEFEDGEAFISMTALPLEWQNKYIEAITEHKKLLTKLYKTL
jgi:hypothetical protein